SGRPFEVGASRRIGQVSTAHKIDTTETWFVLGGENENAARTGIPSGVEKDVLEGVCYTNTDTTSYPILQQHWGLV
ncbi:MAG: hypothetical protein AAF826_00340, partial [Pseudomonadota bacterium]